MRYPTSYRQRKFYLENARTWASIVFNQQNHFFLPDARPGFPLREECLEFQNPCGRNSMPMPKSKLTEHSPIMAAAATPATPVAEFSGQRRLIRPTLSLQAVAGRYGHGPALTARGPQSGPHEDSSHAEVFYYQKQIQAQTRMIVVLENGEQLEGVIEWYDRYAIKLRNLGHSDGDGAHGAGRTRVLIYKDGIRYIYKAGENAPQTMS